MIDISILSTSRSGRAESTASSSSDSSSRTCVAAAGKWASVHGVGPFHVLPVVEQEAVVRGEPAPVSIQVGVAQAGPVQIELIQQHCDRPSIFRELEPERDLRVPSGGDGDSRL